MEAPGYTPYASKLDESMVRYIVFAAYTAYGLLFLLLVLNIINWLVPEPDQFLSPDWMQMQANTATAILLAALMSLTGMIGQRKLRYGTRVAMGGVILVILANSWLQLWSGSSANALNRFLVSGSNAVHVFPVSYQSILCIVLLTVLPLFNSTTSKVLSIIHDILSSLLAGLLIFFSSSYLFNALQFVSSDDHVLLSSYTLIALILLVFVNIAGKRSPGIFAIIISTGSGAELSRILLFPVIFLIFFFLTILQNLLNQEFINLTEAFAIATAMLVIGSGFLIMFLSLRINNLEHQLNELATRDDLTDLLNRRGFFLVAAQEIKTARRVNKSLCLLYFDLNNLKFVNDKYGHSVGSELIKVFSQSLSKVFKDNHIVSRIGGDEFVVLTHKPLTEIPEDIDRLDKRIRQYTDYLTLPEYSYGVVEIRAIDNEPLEVILEKAEALMYTDKRRRKAEKDRQGASYSI